MQRVLSVTDVKLTLDANAPPQLLIYAEGKVPTSGWVNPALSAWRYIDNPQDGIQDFDFAADEPQGITLQVVSPITATLHAAIDVENYWGPKEPLKGVRIHARDNSEEALLGSEKQIATFDRPVPWPWHLDLQKGSLAEPISTLVGRQARMYHEGQAITFDRNPTRLNIELVKDGQTIQRVWFG